MENKTVLEVIAPSIEEAIEQGLEQLGLPKEAVEIEVLDSGSKGLFGIGNRQARVRLIVGGNPGNESADAEIASAEEEEDVEFSINEIVKAEKPGGRSAPVDIENALDVTQSVVEDLIEKLRVHATVKTELIGENEHQSEPVIHVDVQGNDLSILIGRQAETLNAIQYITSLIVAKELGQWVTILVDVQGYRARRENQLRKLARRLADQAIQTGRRQVLEPMPANERRYIHLELRDNPDVTTESIGEEPNRKVTITPKR
jgi:spoIIIJ-associated protein